MDIKIVGSICFDDHELNVYGDLEEPLFMAVEIAKLIDYSTGNTSHMLEKICEEDEIVVLVVRSSYGRNGTTRYQKKYFVTELGLYNILSQSRKPIARKWRRIVHQQLIDMRKEKKLNIVEQFEDWDHELDDIFIDPETDIMMRSITIQGGDVIQVPYEEEE